MSISTFALFDGLASLLGYMVGRYFATGEVLGPVGSGHHTSVPYGAFEASDGYVVLACMTDTFWPRVCESLGLPEMAADGRLDTYDKRHENRRLVNDAVAQVIATKDRGGVVRNPRGRGRSMRTDSGHCRGRRPSPDSAP